MKHELYPYGETIDATSHSSWRALFGTFIFAAILLAYFIIQNQPFG